MARTVGTITLGQFRRLLEATADPVLAQTIVTVKPIDSGVGLAIRNGSHVERAVIDAILRLAYPLAGGDDPATADT